MFVLGLTGSIAMGKSTASAIFKSYGVPIFDADAEVHRLLRSDAAAAAAVTAVFPGARAANGTIDRAALGRLVFGDAVALARLEGIIHPRVWQAERSFLARACAQGERAVVLDIPLLFEAGSERLVDAVAVVSAPAFLQAQRALRRRTMTPERLAAISARQMPDAEKRRRADFTIPSGLGQRLTTDVIGRIVGRMRARRGEVWPSAWRRLRAAA